MVMTLKFSRRKTLFLLLLLGIQRRRSKEQVSLPEERQVLMYFSSNAFCTEFFKDSGTSCVCGSLSWAIWWWWSASSSQEEHHRYLWWWNLATSLSLIILPIIVKTPGQAKRMRTHFSWKNILMIFLQLAPQLI